MNRFFLAMLAGASVVAAMFATQPASADTASDWDTCGRTGGGQVQIDACTRIIESDRSEARGVAFGHRGTAYIYAGSYQRAIDDLDKAIPLLPVSALFTFRGTAYSLLKRYRRAIQDFDQAIKLEPQAVDFNNRGYCYFQLGQYQQSIQDNDRAIALKPDFAAAFYIRGHAKLKSGDKSGGNADVATAMKFEPKIAEQYAAYGVKP